MVSNIILLVDLIWYIKVVILLSFFVIQFRFWDYVITYHMFVSVFNKFVVLLVLGLIQPALVLKVCMVELMQSDCYISLEPVEGLSVALFLDFTIVICLPSKNIVSSEIFGVFTWPCIGSCIFLYLLWGLTFYKSFAYYTGGLLLTVDARFGFCSSNSWNGENPWTFTKESFGIKAPCLC